MDFLFNQVFWGIMLIVLGITIVIKVLFNINIPVFRVVFACGLIYIGIWFLIGGKFGWQQPGNNVIFNHKQIKITEPTNEEFNVIFGEGMIDLTDIHLDKGVTNLKINTIFGKGVIKIDPNIPTKIVITSPFAVAEMPDGNRITFGNDYIYKSKNYQDETNYLRIKADVVFGELKIIENRP